MFFKFKEQASEETKKKGTQNKSSNFALFTLISDILLIIKKLVYMADNKLIKKIK
jgi:hypothetical protein